MNRRPFLALPGLLALAQPFLSRPALAQSRPVRLIVPFPAGGATDAVSRLFAPLLGPGVEGFIVQTEIRESDEAFLAATPNLTDLRPRLTSFTETAAALHAMDVVVCVDTSVAHLTGSLGRPAHLLLPSLPDWRWMLEREDTPWYPSMRLHRRARGEDWEAVIARVAAALAAGERMAA